jgi:fibronectin-binding autotransporter adhesin
MHPQHTMQLSRWVRCVAFSLLLGFGLLTGTMLVSGKAHAATTLTVSNCSNDSQLQADVKQANSDNAGDIINFSCSGDIPLTATLNITGSMTIDGSGQSITLDGQHQRQVIYTSSSNLTLNALTIANGNGSTPGSGGGIYNKSGTVSITNSTLSGNSASIDGGGIDNEAGTVSISTSTLSNNSTTVELSLGGGIANNRGTVSISTSTLSGNSAYLGYGGGIFNGDGTLTISTSTLSGNSAFSGEGGGIDNESGTVSSDGSIVANNTGGDCAENGGIHDKGYNLDSDGSCFTAPTSLHTNPQLAALANNGGPTQTMALQPGSPAIDVIPTSTNLCPSTDQRGLPRPDEGESACDMGAYESGPISLTVSDCSSDSQLQADVTQANRNNDGDSITFSCSGDIKLTATLSITGSMTIDGSGQSITLDGQHQVQVISTSSSDLTLKALTIVNGSSSISGGGIDNESGTVSISTSTLSNNSASILGGGIYNDHGTLTISNSTIANNSADGGGGLFNYFGTVSITNSTLSDNSTPKLGGGDGGGLSNVQGTLTISSSTIANNSAGSSGGGIYNYGTLSSDSSIVAENTGGDCLNYASIQDKGYNLDSDGSCDFTGTGSLKNTNPQLAALANNGGPTQTMALQQGSPAIDVIPTSTNLCPSADQRGDARPDDNESSCDLGAYESNYASLSLSGTTVNATEGTAFNGEVASGTYTGNGSLSATIHWGDGSHSRGTISGTGTFTVSGSHTYAEEGSYTISITVSNGTGDKANATSTATVSDAQLTLTHMRISSSNLLAVLKASFTDADPHGQVTDYTASINWGDGTTTPVTVIKNPLGKGFVLTGQHQYASKGTYSVTLTVSDAGGSQVTKTVSITVK